MGGGKTDRGVADVSYTCDSESLHRRGKWGHPIQRCGGFVRRILRRAGPSGLSRVVLSAHMAAALNPELH
jgi:hypothetical protein